MKKRSGNDDAAMTKNILRASVLIEGISAPTLVDPAVAFEDGRITAVGNTRDFGKSGEERAEIIGFGMGTIMPGLIDAHEHLDLR